MSRTAGKQMMMLNYVLRIREKLHFGHLLMGELKELSFRRVKIEFKNIKTTVYIKRQFRIWSKLTGVPEQDNWICMHFLCEQASALG